MQTAFSMSIKRLNLDEIHHFGKRMQTYRPTDLQTYRPTDLLADLRNTDLQTYRPTDLQTYRPTG